MQIIESSKVSPSPPGAWIETKKIEITAFDLALRFMGIAEAPGIASNTQIMAMLKLDNSWPHDDSVPWCSAFINYIAWLLRLPRSQSLRARSWLSIGSPVDLIVARIGFDVVILKNGPDAPGPETIKAPGHVGFYAGHDDTFIHVLGGNQSNQVTVAPFKRINLLAIRRLF